MPLAHWLFQTSQAHPDLPAVALGPRASRSYAQLASRAAALASFLRGLKLGRNTPVAIVAENRVEIVETLFACWWSGHPVAPIDPRLPQDDLAARLAYSEAEACFASPRAATKTLAAAPEGLRHIVEYEGPSYARALASPPLAPPEGRPSGETAWLSFSDRAPGEPPRAAMMSFQALMSLTTSILAEIETFKPRDAQIHALPWTAAGGFMLLPALARGGVNVMPETGDFDAAEFFENAKRWRRASTLVSAHQLRAMLASEAPTRPEYWRTIEIAGLDVSRPLIEKSLERFGPRLARIFGNSAFPLGLTRLNSHDVSARREPGWAERVASVGRPFLSTQISIRSEDGRGVLQNGEVGSIYARGLHGMRGYWRDRRSRVNQAGTKWRRLGLRGALDGRGYLSVLGPAEDLLEGEAGRSIAPDAIETALIDKGAADDIGVIMAPDAPAKPAAKPSAAPKGKARRRPASLKPSNKLVMFFQNRGSGELEIELGDAPPVTAIYEVPALPRSASGRLHRNTLRRWAQEQENLSPGRGKKLRTSGDARRDALEAEAAAHAAPRQEADRGGTGAG